MRIEFVGVTLVEECLAIKLLLSPEEGSVVSGATVEKGTVSRCNELEATSMFEKLKNFSKTKTFLKMI